MKARVTDQIILTAGPSISNREATYGLDAILNGWNSNWKFYIKKFEKCLTELSGMRHGAATSSCTGAMHLLLAARGIGAGDEVLVPEITWVATVSAVLYLGATPVFVDVDPVSWTMDPGDLARKITSTSKAIIPVHLYGHPADMDPIMAMAQTHGLFVMEDAAPSLGAEYKGRKTGGLAHASAFSFQGAKAFVMGEGGIALMNDDELYDEFMSLWDHGRDPDNPLSGKQVGYKYKLSNVQAAIGLAQVERAGEILERKRQINAWYHRYLGDVEEIKVSSEHSWAKSLHWMTSIQLGPAVTASRQEFIASLKERNIDTRPVFEPLSSQTFIRERGLIADNPVSREIGTRAINLPSGHDRTVEEIAYVCTHIRELLAKEVVQTQGFGVLDVRDTIRERIRDLKQNPSKLLSISTPARNEHAAVLRTIGTDDLDNEASINLLRDWREAAIDAYVVQGTVTFEGTAAWLKNAVVGNPDRVLFWVELPNGKRAGHLGLYRFDYYDRRCEIDNVVRGTDDAPGIMTDAVKTMVEYATSTLSIDHVYLRVFSDNAKAIALYKRCGFSEISRVPLMRVERDETTQWEPVLLNPYLHVQRYFVTMKFSKNT